MANTGWISIHRQLKENWIWRDEKKLKWWLDILLSVNYADQKVLLKGKLIECKRGQCVKSLETWAKEWRTTKRTVQGFLKLLEKEQMIGTENVTVSTRITVCKYDSYNTFGNDDGYAASTQTTPHGIRRLPPNNKGNKEETIEIKYPFVSESFLTAWGDWKKYKKVEHKFSFKSELSEQKSLNLLHRESHQIEKEAIAMLDYAMAKGWQGWVPKDDVNFYSGNKSSERTVMI